MGSFFGLEKLFNQQNNNQKESNNPQAKSEGNIFSGILNIFNSNDPSSNDSKKDQPTQVSMPRTDKAITTAQLTSIEVQGKAKKVDDLIKQRSLDSSSTSQPSSSPVSSLKPSSSLNSLVSQGDRSQVVSIPSSRSLSSSNGSSKESTASTKPQTFTPEQKKAIRQYLNPDRTPRPDDRENLLKFLTKKDFDSLGKKRMENVVNGAELKNVIAELCGNNQDAMARMEIKVNATSMAPKVKNRLDQRRASIDQAKLNQQRLNNERKHALANTSLTTSRRSFGNMAAALDRDSRSKSPPPRLSSSSRTRS